MDSQGTCDRPGCDHVIEQTYSDEYGNQVGVCAKDYWRLVTGERTRHAGSGFNGELGRIDDVSQTSGQTLYDMMERGFDG